MKNTILIFFLFICVIKTRAQEQPAESKVYSNNLSLGIHLNNFQNDFGYGLSLTSPFFPHTGVALKASGNIAYNDGVLKNDSISNWRPYYSFQFGTIATVAMIAKCIRVYGAGGMIILFPNSTVSSNKTEFGGYGSWGFEFIINPRMSYYLELGGVGTGARADKAAGKSLYSNGFLTTAGMHFYF